MDQMLSAHASTFDKLAALPEDVQIGRDLLSRLPIEDIDLIKLTGNVSAGELVEKFPNCKIFACDFHVNYAASQKPEPWGFAFNDFDVVNIDHHAPASRMYTYISSGNLAAEYVKANGPLTSDARLILNHTDCDSVISALIMRGHIPPHRLFTDAVIAADHSGEKNKIADLLQALDQKRNINFSARNLAYLLMGQPLEPDAEKLLQRRLKGRQETIDAIQSEGPAADARGLVVMHMTPTMRNQFMPALFPQAAIIMTHEAGSVPGRWVARLRLGEGAPAGFTIFSLNMQDIDPAYGGRWNAGSNKRGGETTVSLGDYVAKLTGAVNLALQNTAENASAK